MAISFCTFLFIASGDPFIIWFTVLNSTPYVTFSYFIYFLAFLPATLEFVSAPPLSTIIASITSLLVTIILPVIATAPLRKIAGILRLPAIAAVVVNVLIIFPLWVAILDVWLFPFLAGQTIDFITTTAQIYGLNFAFFLLITGVVYIISSMLMATDDFFWLLPGKPDFSGEADVPDIKTYTETELATPITSALSEKTTIIELQNQIHNQQAFCDSKAQSLGGITGALGLVGVGLSLLDGESRASLFSAVAQVLNTLGVVPQESGISLTSILETTVIVVIFAVVAVLLKGLSNLYRKIYILELMDQVCSIRATLIPEVTTIEEPKPSGLWAAIRNLLR